MNFKVNRENNSFEFYKMDGTLIEILTMIEAEDLSCNIAGAIDVIHTTRGG